MSETAFQKLLKRYEGEVLLGLPEGMNQAIVEAFEAWLSEEEAEFLSTLPSGVPAPLEAVAEKAGMSADDAKKMIDTLIDKTMVVDHEVEGLEGKRLYSLANWIVFGENYFHRYVDLDDPAPSELDKKLARWFENIKKEDSLTDKDVHLSRLLPIEKVIEDVRGVLPLPQASKVIDEASYVSLSECFCRGPSHLLGENCDHPIEVCFSMDDYARYQVENGFAREVTKEEAKKILRECEERGLIHVTDNIKGENSLLCNCCSCHCIPLTGLTRANKASRFAYSPFLSAVDSEKCQGSGLCVETCPFKAISLVDDKAHVDEEECVGCGLCNSVCPFEALSMKERTPDKAHKFYENFGEFIAHIPSE